MSIVINLLYVMTKIPWLLVMLWRSSLILVVCLAWYKLLNEMSKWLFSGVELDSWLDGDYGLLSIIFFFAFSRVQTGSAVFVSPSISPS